MGLDHPEILVSSGVPNTLRIPRMTVCEVMEVLTNPTVVIISQNVNVSNHHHTAHLKLSCMWQLYFKELEKTLLYCLL